MTCGLTRSTVLACSTLIYGLTAVSYKMRMPGNWHRDSELGDPEHPLLRLGSECHGFVYLTADQAAALYDDHMG